jgi:hypothetical protein
VSNGTFGPLAFLAVANALATEDADEAALRTAVGRAYYAVFLVARSRSGVMDTQFAHERVRSALSTSSTRLASVLGSMSRLRMIADYEPMPRNVQERDWRRNWEKTRRNADSVLEELARLPD